MDKNPNEIPLIENAADYVDALMKLPEHGAYWLKKKAMPGRRMRDKLIQLPAQREKQEIALAD